MILAAKPGGTKVTAARTRSHPNFSPLERCKGAPLLQCNTTPKLPERPLRAGFGWS